MAVTQQSLYLQQQGYRLHIRYLAPDVKCSRQPVLMVHGSIGNGRIFYTESGKGLAAFLARQGHPVYVLDQRGRGGSEPPISAGDDHGQFHAITVDLPAVQAFIVERHHQPVHWIAHSWGGVLLASTLIRYPALAEQVSSQVYFGTKRVINSWSWERVVKVELFWKRLALTIARFKGYLPVVELKMGADNETQRSLMDNVAWITPGAWLDSEDGFDYGNQAVKVKWPSSLLLAAVNDRALGNPLDVQAFIKEMGGGEYQLLSRGTGYRHDYDHINMLTHPDAGGDHFTAVAEFMRRQESLMGD